MDKPTIAIIGIGRWGKNLLTHFAQIAQVAAVCYQGDAATAYWLQHNYPAIPRRSLEQILADHTITAAVIATPPASHAEIVIACLRAGKDVFVEKPAGLHVHETQMILEAAVQYERIVMVGYVYLYDPALKKVRAIFRERGEKIEHITLSWQKWGSFEYPLIDNLLCHEFALTASLFPDFDSAKILSTKTHKTSCDELLVELYQKKDSIGTSQINRFSSVKKKTVTLTGSHGSVFVWEDTFLFERKGEIRTPIVLKNESSLDAECRAFVETIQAHKQPEGDIVFAVKIRSLLDTLDEDSPILNM